MNIPIVFTSKLLLNAKYVIKNPVNIAMPAVSGIGSLCNFLSLSGLGLSTKSILIAKSLRNGISM